MVDAIPAPDVAALRGGVEVHVWLLRADRPEAVEMLSRQERLDATRFRISADRQRYVVARTALRLLLARYTGEEPDALVITGGAGKKPALAGGALEFNVSHSGAWVALAFSAGAPVGVDIEEVRPLPEYRDLVRHFFTPAERARVTALPPTEGIAELFRLWTRKEALLKGLGKGLSQALDAHDVVQDTPDSAPGWTIVDLPPPEGYFAAVAMEGSARVKMYGRA
jgi:4'-phosphopantetheinyl transferase